MSGGCSFPYWETKPKKNPTHLVVTATIWRKPAIQDLDIATGINTCQVSEQLFSGWPSYNSSTNLMCVSSSRPCQCQYHLWYVATLPIHSTPQRWLKSHTCVANCALALSTGRVNECTCSEDHGWEVAIVLSASSCALALVCNISLALDTVCWPCTCQQCKVHGNPNPDIQVEHERERRVMGTPQDFTKKMTGEEELIRLRPKCHFGGVEPHVHMKRFDKDRMGWRALHCELQGLKLYAHPFCCTLGFYPPHILCCSSALVHRYQFCHATLLSIWNGLPFY